MRDGLPTRFELTTAAWLWSDVDATQAEVRDGVNTLAGAVRGAIVASLTPRRRHGIVATAHDVQAFGSTNAAGGRVPVTAVVTIAVADWDLLAQDLRDLCDDEEAIEETLERAIGGDAVAVAHLNAAMTDLLDVATPGFDLDGFTLQTMDFRCTALQEAAALRQAA